MFPLSFLRSIYHRAFIFNVLIAFNEDIKTVPNHRFSRRDGEAVYGQLCTGSSCDYTVTNHRFSRRDGESSVWPVMYWINLLITL